MKRLLSGVELIVGTATNSTNTASVSGLANAGVNEDEIETGLEGSASKAQDLGAKFEPKAEAEFKPAPELAVEVDKKECTPWRKSKIFASLVWPFVGLLIALVFSGIFDALDLGPVNSNGRNRLDEEYGFAFGVVVWFVITIVIAWKSQDKAISVVNWISAFVGGFIGVLLLLLL